MKQCFVLVKLWQSKTDAPVFKEILGVFRTQSSANTSADKFNTAHLDSKFWAEVHPMELSE